MLRKTKLKGKVVEGDYMKFAVTLTTNELI